jgi:hypothetical protein
MGFGVTSADPALSDVVPMGISHFKLRAVKPRNVATVAARCSVMVEACPFTYFTDQARACGLLQECHMP